MKRLLLPVLTAALSIGANCNPLFGGCEKPNLPEPFDLALYPSLEWLDGDVPAGLEVGLTIYKKHCNGKLGTALNYDYKANASGEFVLQTPFVKSVSVTNRDETLLYDWKIVSGKQGASGSAARGRVRSTPCPASPALTADRAAARRTRRGDRSLPAISVVI